MPSVTFNSNSPPSNTLYADPNSIEHQTTSGGTEYAMVDRKVKDKKHKNPTQPDALYQVLVSFYIRCINCVCWCHEL